MEHHAIFKLLADDHNADETVRRKCPTARGYRPPAPQPLRHRYPTDMGHLCSAMPRHSYRFELGRTTSGLARQIQTKFEVEEIANLPNNGIYLKPMIDVTPNHPLRARAIDIAAVENAKINQVKIFTDLEKADRAPLSGFI